MRFCRDSCLHKFDNGIESMVVFIASSKCRRVEQLVANREPAKFAEAPKFHLRHDMVPVCLAGAYGNAERKSNCLAAFSFGQQLQYFDFPRRERRVKRTFGFGSMVPVDVGETIE